MATIPFPIDVSGGVNRLSNPRRIRDNEAWTLKNIFPNEDGMIAKRRGAEWRYDLAAGLGTPIAITSPPEGAGIDFIAVFRNGTSGTAAGYLSGAFVQASTLTLAQNKRPRMLMYENKFYIFPCAPNAGFEARIWEKATSGTFPVATSTLVFAGTQTERPVPTAVGTYRGRMVFGQGRKLFFGNPMHGTSEPGPAYVGDDVLALNGRHFALDDFESDEIIAIVEIDRSAMDNPASSALLILGRYHAAIMEGEPLVTTDTGDYRGDASFTFLNYKCGCVSADTVVKTDYGLMWASDDDVWLMNVGTLPVRVGTKIRPCLQQSPYDKMYLWYAAFFGGAYRLAVFKDGAGPTDESPLSEQWWLDMRWGPPPDAAEARWFGPQHYEGMYGEEYGVRGMCVQARYGQKPNLLCVSGDSISGWSVCDLEAETAVDDFGLPLTADAQVTFEILTKEYEFGLPRVEKLFMGVELDAWVSEGALIKIDVIADGGRDSDTTQATMDATGWLIGVDPLPAQMRKEYQLVQLPPSASENILGKTLQLRIYDVEAYVIPAEGAGIAFRNNDLDGLDTFYAYTPGAYTADGFSSALEALVVGGTDTATLGIFTGALIPQTRIDHTDAPDCEWRFQTAGTFTAAQLRQSRILGALLGYGTGADLAAATGRFDSTETPAEARSARIEIAGIVLTVYPFGRTTP